MNHGENIHLVIVEESTSKAESHAKTLHSSRFPVHFSQVKDHEALDKLLGTTCPDLVLCGEGPNLPDLESVSTLLRKHSVDIPLIAIASEAPESACIAARHSGAAALVSYDLPGSLQLAFRKELETIQLRHKIDHLELALKESGERYHKLMENTRDAIAYFHEGMHVYANQSYVKMFGFERSDEIEGTPVLNMIDSGDHDNFKYFLRNYHGDSNDTNTLEVRGLEPDGNSFDAVLEFSPAIIDNEPCTQIIIRALSNAELERKLDALSRLDVLTGLSNRQHFMRRVEDNIRAGVEAGQLQAITCILLDNFKTLREEFGIAGSDQILNDVARLIEAVYGQHDTVARFGDRVFTVLHQGSNEESIRQVAETLRVNIEEHVSNIEGRAASTTCSIGISIINEHTRSAENSLSRADLACELARSSGGNQVHVHSTAIEEQVDGEHEEDRDEMIKTTIEEERFQLVYQPIVSLNGDTGQRYEVLLRILDEAGHVILPGQFLSIAGKTGLSGEIDHWVINCALKELQDKQRDATDICFFIKLSDTSLEDRELPLWIDSKLKQYNIKNDCIVFEIPESAAVGNLENTMAFTEAMQIIHCKVALEHYGCSSQAQIIRHLPVDIVKIDGSLINNLASSKEHQEKVRSIIALARTLEKQCIAEQVDDPGSLAILWQFGVDLIQGNFVQEPNRELEYNFEGEIA